ncbi:hypothetical protein M8J76_011282 [Diaphorina citri]|nr:hypothetical protein M8J75_007427 [Diaphorina citri]KAI5745463.1 hypothetical protein M8J76_011282 [Diaphorina citri]KAI5751294.1 hypothetical protein M8J77_006139 [Diaphorina citri]
MRVKFQDEEFIPAVSTGKYIVVTQHFDSPVLDNVDIESPYAYNNASYFHTLQVPQPTLKSPSRMKYPQHHFFPEAHMALLQQTPTKSILRKSSYPVTAAPTKPSRSSYSERGIRAFDWSLRNDNFSKSFDLPDKEEDSNAMGVSSTATDHEQLVNFVEGKTNGYKRSSVINIYENRIADLDFYWTDSDSEPLFTAPQSPMSILSTYLDAESSTHTPEEGKSQASSNTFDRNKNVLYSPTSSFNISNDNDRHMLTTFSSLDSNDNIKLPSLDTPSPESEISCPIFTFADIHAAPTQLTKKIQELSLELNEAKQTQSALAALHEFQSQVAPDGKSKEYVIEFSSDESKTNDEDTDLDFSFIDSLTENSSEPQADRSVKTEYFSESVNTESSKYMTVNMGTDLSDRTQNDVSNMSISSNMVTCCSEDSLHEIPMTILEQPSDQDQSISSCCPL